MILSETTQKLQVVLAGAVTTRELDIAVAYSKAQKTFSIGDTSQWLLTTDEEFTNGTTDVDVVAAPASGYANLIHNLFIRNSDSVSATVSIKVDVSGSDTEIFKFTLAAGDQFSWCDGDLPAVLDSGGCQKEKFCGSAAGTDALGNVFTGGVLTTLGGVSGKLDDWVTPDDNTDLNASASRHGLLRKLSGSATDALRGDGTWAAVAAPGSASGAYDALVTYSVAADIVRRNYNIATVIKNGTGDFTITWDTAFSDAYYATFVSFVDADVLEWRVTAKSTTAITVKFYDNANTLTDPDQLEVVAFGATADGSSGGGGPPMPATSVQFDGADDVLEGEDLTLQPAAITVAGMVTLSGSLTDYQTVAQMPYSPGSSSTPFDCWNLSAILGGSGSPFAAITVSGVRTVLEGTTDLVVGVTYWLVLTYDGTTARLYVNGTQEDSEAVSGVIDYSSNAPGTFTVGSRESGDSDTLDGHLHRLIFWDRALTSGEVDGLNGLTIPASGQLRDWNAATLAGTLNDGDPVSSWADDVASETITQGTGGKQPTLQE